MKRFYSLWLPLLLLPTLFLSCSNDSGGGSDPPITEIEVTIDDLDPENLPTEPTWVITNEDVTTKDDFANLVEALDAAASEEREVEIVLSSVETLPEGSFEDCTSLTSISLPATTTISESAFSGCTSLTTITVPVAEEVSANAFSGCSALEEIALPSTTTIGAGAFGSCNNLTSLELATDVKLQSIATDAFVSSDMRSSTSTITLQITITISVMNWDYINGTVITIDDFSAEFKDIIILGLSDLEVDSPVINDWEDTPIPTE